jgi:hypothetical protein
MFGLYKLSNNRSSQRAFIFLLFLMVALQPLAVYPQTKVVDDRNQAWLGYITSTTFSKKYSWWNDFHYVPDGFFVARTGLTRHTEFVNITAGYAYLLIPVSSINTDLKRTEHRPWSQLAFSFPISGSVSFIQRIRYDARFKQDVMNDDLQSDYSFTNRVRFLAGLKKTFNTTTEKRFRPFIAISNEVLLNFGKQVVNNTFDQNRIQFSVGIQSNTIQYQVGYMNRFVQTGAAQYTRNHTVLIWVVHKFSLSTLFQTHDDKEVSHGD